jgi:hypothetical protein
MMLLWSGRELKIHMSMTPLTPDTGTERYGDPGDTRNRTGYWIFLIAQPYSLECYIHPMRRGRIDFKVLQGSN